MLLKFNFSIGTTKLKKSKKKVGEWKNHIFNSKMEQKYDRFTHSKVVLAKQSNKKMSISNVKKIQNVKKHTLNWNTCMH